MVVFTPDNTDGYFPFYFSEALGVEAKAGIMFKTVGEIDGLRYDGTGVET